MCVCSTYTVFELQTFTVNKGWLGYWQNNNQTTMCICQEALLVKSPVVWLLFCSSALPGKVLLYCSACARCHMSSFLFFFLFVWGKVNVSIKQWLVSATECAGLGQLSSASGCTWISFFYCYYFFFLPLLTAISNAPFKLWCVTSNGTRCLLLTLKCLKKRWHSLNSPVECLFFLPLSFPELH